MKKILIVLITALLCVSCNVNDSKLTYNENQFEIMSVEKFDYTPSNLQEAYIIVHKETGVMYMYTTGFYKAGLTVMLNPDGTPCVYKKK